jgi:hypothetical protein
MMEAVCASETGVDFNESARSYIPEGYHLQCLPLYTKYLYERKRSQTRKAMCLNALRFGTTFSSGGTALIFAQCIFVEHVEDDFILATANLKTTFFCDTGRCSLVELGRRFKDKLTHCLSHEGDNYHDSKEL